MSEQRIYYVDFVQSDHPTSYCIYIVVYFSGATIWRYINKYYYFYYYYYGLVYFGVLLGIQYFVYIGPTCKICESL